MKKNCAVYKMIDFSPSEGHLYISIMHGQKETSNLSVQLNSRKNKNLKIDLPIKVYGDYVEISVSIDDLFNGYIIKTEEVWDLSFYNDVEKIDICLDGFKSFMTDYYPMKQRLYIAKPYITGLNTIAVFIKQDNFSFDLEHFEQKDEFTKLDIKLQGKYIKDFDSRIKYSTLYFKKRAKKLSEDEYEYISHTLSKIDFKASTNNIIHANCSFKECFKYEVLPQKKNPLDGFIVLEDYRNGKIELPLVIETTWDSKPYVGIDKNIKACWFKNYQGAIGICTNKR